MSTSIVASPPVACSPLACPRSLPPQAVMLRRLGTTTERPSPVTSTSCCLSLTLYCCMTLSYPLTKSRTKSIYSCCSCIRVIGQGGQHVWRVAHRLKVLHPRGAFSRKSAHQAIPSPPRSLHSPDHQPGSWAV